MNNHLAPFFTQILPYHTSFSYILLLLCFVYLALTQFGSGKSYALRIRYFLPIYHMFLAFMIMTGLLLMAIFDFKLSFKSAKMIVIALVLIALSALGYKRLKIYIRTKNLAKFKNFALFCALAQIILVIVAGL